MHWTAILRDQTLPSNARVAGNLPCVSCGYNLRLARPRGRCPECGEDVLASVHAATEPHGAARDLRRLGASFLTCVAYVLVISSFSRQWLMVPGFFILGAGLVMRLVATFSLRESLSGLPKAGPWAAPLWLAACSEALVLALFAGSGVLALNPASTTFDSVFDICRHLWWAVLVVQMGLLGLLGHVLSSSLGYALLRWESFTLLLFLSLGTLAAVAAGFAVAAAFGSISDWWRLASGFWLVPGGLSIVLTSVLLLHLSNATERVRQHVEDVLEAAP